jgi:two-component system, NarL family, response regulator YdfI
MIIASSAIALAGLQSLLQADKEIAIVGTAIGIDPVPEDADVILKQRSTEIEYSQIPCVLITDRLKEDWETLLKKNVRGAIPADSSGFELCAAIRAAAAGLLFMHPALQQNGKPPDELLDAPAGPLTPRETEILRLLADGMANKEIASALKISEHTVKFHINSIYMKLDVSGRAQAVKVGMKRGLIPI